MCASIHSFPPIIKMNKASCTFCLCKLCFVLAFHFCTLRFSSQSLGALVLRPFTVIWRHGCIHGNLSMDAVLSLRPSAVVIGCRENHKLGLSDQKKKCGCIPSVVIVEYKSATLWCWQQHRPPWTHSGLSALMVYNGWHAAAAPSQTNSKGCIPLLHSLCQYTSFHVKD